MFKHKIDKIVIFEGKTYIPVNGIVTLPKLDKRYNPIEEIKTEETKTDWKQLAIDAGLEDEDLKKFMKMSVANRKKKLNIED